MSWDIHLEDAEGHVLEVPKHMEGGTYAMEGTPSACLNVTYNYSDVTRLVGFGFKESLNNRRAAVTIPDLEHVVDTLGTKKFENYWAPTPGNAGYAASILLNWAKLHPDAYWRVK